MHAPDQGLVSTRKGVKFPVLFDFFSYSHTLSGGSGSTFRALLRSCFHFHFQFHFQPHAFWPSFLMRFACPFLFPWTVDMNLKVTHNAAPKQMVFKRILPHKSVCSSCNIQSSGPETLGTRRPHKKFADGHVWPPGHTNTNTPALM